jgi:Zn-dependent peptidase ImmA (M78 family)
MTLTPDADRGVRAAAEARNALGTPVSAPLEDILATLERSTELEVFVIKLGSDGIAGAYQSKSGRDWVIVNADDSVERQRFTLAHEYGHHCLGHGDSFDTASYVSDPSPKEVQANYFAGAFLVSAEALDRALERMKRPVLEFEALVALAVYFGVSARAMRIRLETLGRLNAREIGELDRRIESKQHYGLGRVLGVTPIADSFALAKREGGRVPSLMLARALAAVEGGLIPKERLPELLHISAEAIEAQSERESISAE